MKEAFSKGLLQLKIVYRKSINKQVFHYYIIAFWKGMYKS